MSKKKLKMTTYSKKLAPRFIYYVSLILLLSGAACQEENQLKTVVQPSPPKVDEKPAVEASQEKQKQEKGETEVTKAKKEVVDILLKTVAKRCKELESANSVMSVFLEDEDFEKKKKNGTEIALLKELEQQLKDNYFEQVKKQESAEEKPLLYLKVSEALAALAAGNLSTALEKAKEAEKMVGVSEETKAVTDRDLQVSIVGTKEEEKPSNVPPGLDPPPGLSPKLDVLPPATSGKTEEVIFVGTRGALPTTEPDLSKVAISVKRVFFDQNQNLVCVLDLTDGETGKNLNDPDVTVPPETVLQVNTKLFHCEALKTNIESLPLLRNVKHVIKEIDENDFFFILNLENEVVIKAFSQPSLSLRDTQLIANDQKGDNEINLINIDIDEEAVLPCPEAGSIHITLAKANTTNSYNIQISSDALIDARELKFYLDYSSQKQTSYIVKIVQNVFSFSWVGGKKRDKIQTVIEQVEQEQDNDQLNISYARLFKDVVYNVPFSLPDNHNITGIKVEYEDESGRVISNTYLL